MQKVYQLKVSQVDRETPDAVTIHFPQAKVHKIWYISGQFLTVVIRMNGETHYRSYSICTSPRLDDTMAITVKRVPGGLVSNYLNDTVKPGDEIEFLQPAGKFTIENSVKYRRQIFLIGGGSGITPLFSILRSVLFNEPKSKVVLLYANRREEQVIFLRQIKELETLFPDRLRVIWFLSQGNGENGFQKGRITRENILSLLGSTKDPSFTESRYYLCGPDGLMREAEAGLVTLGINREQILKEHFLEKIETPASKGKDRPPREVSVQYGPDNHTFSVPAGARILPAALVQDIVLPFSCLKGNCATCMGKVLEGEVEMVRNEGLTDQEVENGYVLVCQAKPLGDGVRIRMGR